MSGSFLNIVEARSASEDFVNAPGDWECFYFGDVQVLTVCIDVEILSSFNLSIYLCTGPLALPTV
jgi:hypothetical protein